MYLASSLRSTPGVVAILWLCLAAVPAQAAGGKGLTYGVYGHDSALGIDRVGLLNTGNPYVGDTVCKKKLPVLCFKFDGSLRPGYVPGPNGAFYEGWVEGHLAPTLPTKGIALTSLAVADALCVTSFGPGWRMAEFHDGAYVSGMNATNYCNSVSTGCTSPWPAGQPHGGHSMWAYSNLNPAVRYWTYINDQPGNCWNP